VRGAHRTLLDDPCVFGFGASVNLD
jgi:hypothetical protein